MWVFPSYQVLNVFVVCKIGPTLEISISLRLVDEGGELHVIFFIPLIFFMRKTFLASHRRITSFCVVTKFIDLIFGMSDITKVSGIRIQETIFLFLGGFESTQWFRNLLFQLPIVLSSCWKLSF